MKKFYEEEIAKLDEETDGAKVELHYQSGFVKELEYCSTLEAIVDTLNLADWYENMEFVTCTFKLASRNCPVTITAKKNWTPIEV